VYYAGVTSSGEARAKLVEEGLAYFDECREVLVQGLRDLGEDELDFMASLVIESEGRLGAQTAAEENAYRLLSTPGWWEDHARGAYSRVTQTLLAGVKQEIDALKAQYQAARAERQVVPDAPPVPAP
jgi:hypothetical protein